jgi:hypothetical protein
MVPERIPIAPIEIDSPAMLPDHAGKVRHLLVQTKNVDAERSLSPGNDNQPRPRNLRI